MEVLSPRPHFAHDIAHTNDGDPDLSFFRSLHQGEVRPGHKSKVHNSGGLTLTLTFASPAIPGALTSRNSTFFHSLRDL